MHYFCDSHLISADTSKNVTFNISITRHKTSDKLAATISYNTRMKIFSKKKEFHMIYLDISEISTVFSLIVLQTF